MAGKIFDANKYEIGKVANATYEYLLANVQTIAKELLYNVRQLAENKYGLDSRGLPSGTVTEAEFLFAFMECVDLVINAYRPMVESGCLHSSTFDYWLNGVGTKKSFPVLKCFLDPKDQDPGDLKAAGIHTLMLTGDNARTAAVVAQAVGVDEVIAEVAASRVTERGTRADDRRSESAMEDRKKQGYF